MRRYAEQTDSTIATPAGRIAVLPLAAIESHGPHLPLGTDLIIAEGFLDRAAALGALRRSLLRLPPVWLGVSIEHRAGAGTLSQEAETLIASIVAVGEGLAASGIDRLILFNAHGGNVAAASIAALKLRDRVGMLVVSAHWMDLGLPPELAPPTPVGSDVHGGWLETSLMLVLRPDLVSLEAAKPAPAAAPAPLLFPSGGVGWGWLASDLAGGSTVGNPELATEAIGRSILDHGARELVRLIEQTAGVDWPPSR